VSIRKTYPMQAYKIMHGLWGMGQMMFTKYIVVADDDVDVHNTSDVLFPNARPRFWSAPFTALHRRQFGSAGTIQYRLVIAR
jgi:3-octaprenyl-4-hydroxybenzoate carboxy-lyase